MADDKRGRRAVLFPFPWWNEKIKRDIRQRTENSNARRTRDDSGNVDSAFMNKDTREASRVSVSGES
ncbi:hypothetical protein NDU88_002497 [Pleurodeles waltl]|uniref:Uncharacterized protein n=1 Tax=Pleurodeles waltl TaxID=8319 RepID=A0AAV7KUY1_PLEWA|nr:hypothetical protein NDU88_002497 [Pleurodeles waltl]